MTSDEKKTLENCQKVGWHLNFGYGGCYPFSICLKVHLFVLDFYWFEIRKCLIILGQYLKITAIVSIARTFGKSYFELIDWGQRVGFFSKSLFCLLLQNQWNKFSLWNRKLNFRHSSRIHWLIVIKILKVNQEKQCL